MKNKFFIWFLLQPCSGAEVEEHLNALGVHGKLRRKLIVSCSICRTQTRVKLEFQV